MDFYSIKLKRLIDARKISTRLDFLLTNAYLNNLLKKYLIAAINNDDADIEYSNESELIIRKKSTDDCFHLTIKKDNSVDIIVNKSSETIKIEIIVDEEENRINFNREITIPNKTKTLSEKTIERRTYIDNALRYEYYYTSFEDLYPYNSEYITVSETYIDLDSHAVIQKMILSGDKDKEKDMKLDYFETNSISTTPFNNLVDCCTIKSDEIIPSTKEVFYEFINGSNNVSPVL